MFYQLHGTPEYHLNLRLLPRLSINAGFELSTGIYINTVSPEKAASYLRGDLI
jgi:UDPglucose--hexose-1-phosphate uridylyltransferase